MPRNMVSGKPSNQSARQVDIPPTTRSLFYVHTHRHVGVCSARQIGIRDHVVALQTYVLHNWCAYGPAVACGGLSTTRNERQTVASERSLDVPSVCVRFTMQGLNSILNRPLLTKIETAYSFCHIE
jgi:hypothetical protein